MHRLLHNACSAALVLVALAGTSALSSSAVAADLMARATGVDAAEAALRVEARVPALSPGRPGVLEVVVTGDRAARITGIEVRVGDASPQCLADNVAVADFDAGAASSYVVEPGRATSVPLAIMMLDKDSDQDACKGATFPMTYRVTTG